jgi:GT2 family glycosyltransferase
VPSVSLIIVNYNGGEALMRCLQAVAKQTVAPLEVLLVDNASSDGSGERAAAAFGFVTYLPQDSNLGFAAGNNVAAVQARGDWLGLLNPDAYANPRWLEEFVAGTERHPRTMAFGSLQLQDEAPELIDGAGDCFHVLGAPYRGYHGWSASDGPAEGHILAPCAAAAFYRRDAFEAVGGFDERFFCYSEDVDLGMRLFARHGPAVHLPRAIVRHEGSKITGRLSDFTVYHGHRNRIWAWAKNAPPLLFWSLLPSQLGLNLFLLVSFTLRQKLLAYARGARDGLAAVPKLRAERKPGLTSAQLARALVWSPLALRAKRGKVRVRP